MLGYNTFWFKFLALLVASITAALAGVIHSLHQPVVTPNVAGLGWTVTALLIILIGGVGTISGALIGAAVFRLLQFYLEKWFGGASGILIELAFVDENTLHKSSGRRINLMVTALDLTELHA